MEIKITLDKVRAELQKRRLNMIQSIFPDDGQFKRSLYPKHLEFFKAGNSHRERIFIAANRVGKSLAGGYEMTCHLTGIYPEWWQGKRFDKPVTAWASGDTSKTTRDIIQNKLLGAAGNFGTGLIPQKKIIKTLSKQGIPEAIEIIYVEHLKGQSMCVLKSYDQRRESFQGTDIDVIWLDEEPPQDIYTECLLRTMTTKGSVYTTFTPLMGLSDVVLSFCPNGEITEGTMKDNHSKNVTCCDWDAVPHLSTEDKADLLASIPPYQRDARSKGIPQLGSGAIYQVPESEIVVEDKEIPKHWKRVCGMDVGWNRTAAVWGAIDPETQICYIYHEYYRGNAEPAVHAQGIKAPGGWIPVIIDPAARGRGQGDGNSLADMYKDLGLNLQYANNSVEAGIYEVWERFSSGRLKIFKSCANLRAEYRVYRRDEKGRIVKANDHALDALRYMVMSIDAAKAQPVKQDNKPIFNIQAQHGWMG